MHVYIKYGTSVVALLATLSLAQAQNEHQGGGEKGGKAVEHAQPERGKEGGPKERAPAARERSKGETRASPTKEKQPAEHREGEHTAQDKKEIQRQSNASAVTRRPNIHISGVQKTKLHDPKLRLSKYKGAKPRIDRARVQTLKSEGLGPAEIATRLGISRMSVYRLLKESPHAPC